ncbi:MAG: hypothetical protein IKA30_00340 [Alphaproteobacteria bacterium]|nr:hypothetical protein [Alphaproteobacteria bacterium]
MLNNLHEMLKIHKETVLLSGNGFSVDCILKPTKSHAGFQLKGFSSFIGVSFDESGMGCFSDSFELTIDFNALKEQTDLMPTRAWELIVNFPQMDGTPVKFRIENVALDRTLGMYLIKASASTSNGEGKTVQRQSSGGL